MNNIKLLICRILLTLPLILSFPIDAQTANPLQNVVKIRVIENLFDNTSTPSYSIETYMQAIEDVFISDQAANELIEVRSKFLDRSFYNDIMQGFTDYEVITSKDKQSFAKLLSLNLVKAALAQKLLHQGVHPDFIPVIDKLNDKLFKKMAAVIDENNLSAEDIEIYWQVLLTTQGYNRDEVHEFLKQVTFLISNSNKLINEDTRQDQINKLNNEENEALLEQKLLIKKQTSFSNFQKGRLWKKLLFYTTAMTIVYFGMDYYNIESHDAMEALAENSLEFAAVGADKIILGSAGAIDWLGQLTADQNLVDKTVVESLRQLTQSLFASAQANFAPYVVMGVTLAVVHQSISSLFKSVQFYGSEKWKRKASLKPRLDAIKTNFRQKRQDVNIEDESTKSREQQRLKSYILTFSKIQELLEFNKCEKILLPPSR